MSPHKRRFVIALVALVYGLGLVACSSPSCAPSSKPVVTITAPTAGAQVPLNQPLAVQVTALDTSGVSRVELWIDNALVNTQNLPTPQPTAAVTLQWVAAPAGPHALMVRAYNAANVASDPVMMSIVVTDQVAPPAATATTLVPTVTPTPTIPAPTSPPDCRNDLAFAQDVTIPDGAQVEAGARFDKTWRIKNTGTCNWTGYELAFLNGEQMDAPDKVIVPNTLPGQTVDLTVPMTAPGTPGRYTGRWQLRDQAGQAFGTNLAVVVQVIPVPPTAVPLPRADLEIVSLTIPGVNHLKVLVRHNQGDALANRVVALEFEVSQDPGGQIGQTLISPPIDKTISVQPGQTVEIDIGELALDLTQHGYQIKATIGPGAYEETNPANNSITATWQKQPAAMPKADLEATAIWGNADTGYKLGLWVQNNGPDDLTNRTVEIILTISYGTQNQVFIPTYLPIVKTFTALVGERNMILIDEGPTVDLSQYWYELSISVQPQANNPDSYEETNPANNTRYEKWEATPP
ncbi:MAG: hypothetical protein KKA73_00245 [Chloroflexi bacterium]|nr:hypothetical protein [Chloroflexota bacterium]